MKKFAALLCSTAVLMPAAANAQSTGSTEVDIIITGTRSKEVGGVETPPTSKAKVVLNQEMIARQNPGQTILDTINLVPGVSFQNNDAYGSSGGTLSIRGFDSSRISLTFDGIQLNDSGNYAIFSNQQLDPELIEQVNVNLGSTDVDSPTASAVGGTVNYRTLTPTTRMGGRLVMSLGQWDFRRIFGLFNSGELGPLRTRVFLSASKADNNVPFNNYGKIDKQQYNGRVWQPVGTNGDFISVAGHYNENRNNFFGSLPLRLDASPTRVVGPNAQNRYPRNRDERFYDINFPCFIDSPQAGVADAPAPGVDPRTGLASPQFASCGTEFDRRYNPSNTGNIRGASRFTLMEDLVLTVDPSIQFVRANGGGTVTAEEGLRDINPASGTASVATCRTTPNSATNTCVPGYLGGTPFFGRDINGDGDTLDRVTVLAPSQTRTRRPGLITNLRWNRDPNHLFRVSYTLDYAFHRQTGEVGLLQSNGEPEDVFPRNDPQADVTGTVLQKRDRKSEAILNRLAADYNGIFGNLRVNVGLGAPFFVRKLDNRCFTSSASGFVECFGGDAAREAQFAALNPTMQGPQKRKFKYNKLLPNIGAVYDITNQLNVFANYAKGLSVPSTDNLYNSFFFAPDTPEAKPKPEMTDSFDGGVRFRRGDIQAQLSGWFTKFDNRIAQAFDPELNQSIFRNLGRVDKWGIDGSAAYEPNRHITLYAFGSWMRSKIKDDIQFGECNSAQVTAGIFGCTTVGQEIFLDTSGNYESGAPKYTYGLSAVGRLANFELGITAKRTGPRFIFDNAEPIFTGPVANPTEVFPNKAPAYWLVNLDARYNLRALGPELANTYLQLNVYNLFDKFYVGGFGGGLNQSLSGSINYGNPPFVQIGAPRTISASVNVGF